MAEPLGSLCDKRIIVKLKQWHLCGGATRMKNIFRTFHTTITTNGGR
jgi:hypothetical protein